MIKIFSGNKIIYLTKHFKKHIPTEDSVVIKIDIGKKMRMKYKEVINDDSIKEIYFFNRDEDLLFEYFSAMFRNIEAAGGLVKNRKGEYLFIFRNGKWDLPKGKREKGEKIQDCAIREVEEECGIKGLNIEKELTSTFHTYYLEERAVLKTTYWFAMKGSENSILIPQTEEGITEVKWIKKKNFDEVLANTYESIKEVLKEIK